MSHPFEVFGSQKKDDDDGQVIDSFFIETDAPPELKDATEPIDPTPDDKPIRATRLITGTIVMDAGLTEPLLLLAPDTNRLQFNMQVTSLVAAPTLTDYVLIADEKGKIQLPVDGSTPASGLYGRVRSGNNLSLDVHTGAIWIRPNPTITASIEITYWSTTK